MIPKGNVLNLILCTVFLLSRLQLLDSVTTENLNLRQTSFRRGREGVTVGDLLKSNKKTVSEFELHVGPLEVTFHLKLQDTCKSYKPQKLNEYPIIGGLGLIT